MKIIRKVAFIYLMTMMVGVFASVQDPPGPPETCLDCEDLFDENQTNGGSAYQQCQADFCGGGLPIDTSIFYLFLAGTVLASYILLKKPNHKKTPM